MIRERRAEDLDRLCAVLETMQFPASVLSGKGCSEWLAEHDAEQSWVFDMAPVTVAPTKNVIGHVQIYRAAEGDSTSTINVVECTRKPAEDLLIIGKLFVRPGSHESGFASYLLKESVKYIQGHGKIPVLDAHGYAFLSKAFCGRFGFEEIPSGDCGVTLLIHTE